MKRSTKLLLFAFALMLVGGVISGVALFLLLSDSEPEIPEHSYLLLEPGGVIGEAPSLGDPLADALGQAGGRGVIEFDSALRKAAVDDRIDGVILRVEPMAVGLGKVQELRDAVRRFRDTSGKPVIAWVEVAGNKEYYLASAASTVYMAPEGMIFFTGLRFAVTFYKGTLEKLGVEAQFARVGRYKSAVEPFTRTEMSDSFREMLESLADDLYGSLLADIAADRKMSAEQLAAIIDDPPMTARKALEQGLIDGLRYRDELEAELLVDDQEEWSLVGLGRYGLVKPKSLGLGGGPEIAVIYCEGTIMSGESSAPYRGGERSMGATTITRAIRDAREDEDIEAVVLRVDSPGGSGLASDLIWREVVLTKAEKPVVVSMSDYAASGGYYISMAADAIVAQPGTLTGSIGVYSGKFSLAGLYEHVGLTVDTVERGELAGLMSMSEPFDEAERAKLEGMVEEFYNTFITKAAEGREREVEEIDRVARGRVWSGAQAAEVGLVDELGGFRTALDIAKQKAGIADDAEVSLVILPEQRTLLQELLEPLDPSARAAALDAAALARDPVTAMLPTVERPLRRLLTAAPLLGSGEPVTLVPYLLDVE